MRGVELGGRLEGPLECPVPCEIGVVGWLAGYPWVDSDLLKNTGEGIAAVVVVVGQPSIV